MEMGCSRKNSSSLTMYSYCLGTSGLNEDPSLRSMGSYNISRADTHASVKQR